MLLYHYTDQKGFMDIVGNSELSATAIQYLDDTYSYYSVLDTVRDILSQKIDHEEDPDTEFRLTRFRENINNINKINSCVCSLSEESDLSSQWQSYAPSPGGYSIGFNSTTLQELLKPQGFVLKPCIYDTDKQNELIVNTIDEAVLSFIRYKEPEPGVPEYGSASTDYFLKKLSGILPLIQNSFSAEDKEWKIISEEGVSFERLSFGTGPASLIPFYRITLRKDYWMLIRKIIIGATPQPVHALNATRAFISRQEIEASRIMAARDEDKSISVTNSLLTSHR